MNSSSPSPVVALKGTIGASCKKVPATWSAISMLASSRSSASHKSILVRAMIPCLTPTSCMMRKCSSVCGFHPSWPSTTKMHALIPPTPANMLPMNRVWPGTSMNAMLSPLGNCICAKPRSMVRPRSCSSIQRSGLMPVSRRINVDLP
ncbi:unannotated protein [freshwater metagenome]